MPYLEAVNTPPARADVWNVSNAPCRVHYQMRAQAEPDLLCRALKLFALQFPPPGQGKVDPPADWATHEDVIDGLGRRPPLRTAMESNSASSCAMAARSERRCELAWRLARKSRSLVVCPKLTPSSPAGLLA